MLPFQTLQEAEVSLGRNLTFAEVLWFKYSHQKSDYLLYCQLSQHIFLIPFLHVAAMAIRDYRAGPFGEIRRVQDSAQGQEFFSIMLDCYGKVLRTFVLAVGLLQIFSFPVIEWIGIKTSLPLPSATDIFLQILVYFVVEDYANYWLHRSLHCKWGYDKIHRVHHEYMAPIGFAAPYAHWAEIIILGLASFLGPLLVPGHMVTFWLWMIVRQMEAIETHCGYDFPWSPLKFIPFYGGAAFHDYHHYVGGKSQSNFASVLFTYCDYIYGTNKGYRYMQKEVFEKTREKQRQE